MITDARTPLWDPTDESCQSFSKLSASLFALKLKSEYNMLVACFDTMMGGWSASLPKENRLPKSLYAAKKEVEQLGLGHVEYDICLQLQEKRKAEGDSATVSAFEVYVRTKVRKRDDEWAS